MGIREGVGRGRQDARQREGSQERRPRTSQGVLQWLDLRMGPRAAEVGRGQITTALVGSAKHRCSPVSPSTQSVVLQPAALLPPGSLSEMQTLRPRPESAL